MSLKSLKVGSGIEEVAKDHDIFLLDMWGVMHDGNRPYDGVIDAVKKLKDAGKEMIILSNSSKRQEKSLTMLSKLGFDPNDFSQVITSGDVSHRMLAGDETLECETWSVLKDINDRKVFVFGSGSDDESYCTSSGWTLAPIDEANLIVARGTFTICNGETTVNKNDDEDEYFRVLHEALQVAAQRKVPMLVSNPDKVRPDKGFPPMPGAIADQYFELIGSPSEADLLIRRIGKPFPEVYELALKGRDPSKACMVGDALETDVTGGAQSGITTVWVVNDGIHGPGVSEKGDSFVEGAAAVLEEFNQKDGTYAMERQLEPSILLRHFRWSGVDALHTQNSFS